MISFSHHAPLQ